MGVHWTDFGTATPVPRKRPATAAGRSTPSRLEDLLPYPLRVVMWGVETKSEQNQRGHWAVKARRVAAQRQQTAAWLAGYRIHLLLVGLEVRDQGGRLRVTLTRIGRRKFDSDGAVASLKAVRDEVARLLGVDDGNDRIDWRYEQELGSPSNPGVVVEIEAA